VLYPSTKTAHPELVEGLSFLLELPKIEEGQSFDKLRTSGVGVALVMPSDALRCTKKPFLF
jgi:hypothetical protein